jgi:hypothetical protein
MNEKKEEIINVEAKTVEEVARPIIATDDVIALAAAAEKRIDAVRQVKRTALKLTNPEDWTDQQGKPYLMASGSEKIAMAFDISWELLAPPEKIEEADGHYSYNYRGQFRMGSRSTDAEGVRSSRESFFVQYNYEGEGQARHRTGERPVAMRDNERDVKMAAFTNLLGNGITRILGIRNPSWEDLKSVAGITREMVMNKISYRKNGKDPGTLKEPQAKDKEPEIKDPGAPATKSQQGAMYAILKKLEITDEFAAMEKISKIIGKDGEPITSTTALTKGQASLVIQTLQKEVK